MNKTWIAAALLAVAASAGAHGLKIDHAWARPTVAGQPAGGAYLTLQNTGKAPDKLLGGSTPAAAHVELHRMTMEGDVMKMREIAALEIPAGQIVELRPGELHLMLTGLKAPLKAGTSVPLTLRFEKAGELKLELKVEALEPAASPAAEHKH